ncbi:SGNH/GDSL hydrolase family protein [Arthrobacter sp. PAMC25564]|uniref:SGNH/GDSL hydrolase family protein n=1 Tax=Arthrobacter sp. PAMC25564 TaxID=2565366 RepID=UPI0010A29A6D|nr:SGNH/GDSL hydrolase family protein [Arthrobacter sp. PAMC25564]QCB96841.1 SGNH/GDSL hydrolase family protein [Arthrobacter sp. PAMC25564]
MRNASALFRLAAPMFVLGVVLGGCGQAPPSQNPDAAPGSRTGSVQAIHGSSSRTPGDTTTPATLPPGSVLRNPANGRDEVIVEDIRHTAVLIGDSQSEPANAWPRQALAALGYKPFFCGLGGTGFFCGLGGTGFVASNGKTGNYITALQRGDWKLPSGAPPLVVIEGGGNDAAQGATDAQIVSNAEQLISTLQQRYPGSDFVMVGTLARGANYGGGRRTQVDTLLGTIAQKNGIPFVSVGDWLTRYKLTGLLADGLHMTATGHDTLGILLAARLKALGLEAKDAAEAQPAAGY